MSHVYAYQVNDKPDVWLDLIDPAGTLASVERDLRAQFGERLVGVRAHAVPTDTADVSADIEAEGQP